ncbi:Protein CBG27093 [Caenorhabditis briggsae]|uniref:Protein CBG27093 n=1 Tax=Caenorhabditis briggsae TaxID=6238 RepID=B6IHG9_CAEBR|nr:Protein CBG27093 [Caenorhabditis briggsae]CAR99349.1 Protein CBG27093 [Caenorhabditis briggsae]
MNTHIVWSVETAVLMIIIRKYYDVFLQKVSIGSKKDYQFNMLVKYLS